MNGYFWSSKNKLFFHSDLLMDYEDAGWDMSDCEQATDSDLNEFWLCQHPVGKLLSSTEDGRPCWIDIPPPSRDELIAHANEKKLSLQRNAENVIKPLNRAKQLGIATDTELALLLEWEKYSVFLMRVDTSTAPDINWPQQPAE